MTGHATATPRAREETPEQKYLRQIRDAVYFIAVVVFVIVAAGILYAIVLATRAAAGS